MRDLVKRLRNQALGASQSANHHTHPELLREAAARIEALEAREKVLEAALKHGARVFEALANVDDLGPFASQKAMADHAKAARAALSAEPDQMTTMTFSNVDMGAADSERRIVILSGKRTPRPITGPFPEPEAELDRIQGLAQDMYCAATTMNKRNRYMISHLARLTEWWCAQPWDDETRAAIARLVAVVQRDAEAALQGKTE